MVTLLGTSCCVSHLDQVRHGFPEKISIFQRGGVRLSGLAGRARASRARAQRETPSSIIPILFSLFNFTWPAHPVFAKPPACACGFVLSTFIDKIPWR